MAKIPYASVVGSLMYAMVCTRPDIAHVVAVISRLMSNPGKAHWEAVKWLLRYLKGTSKMALFFKGKDAILKGFSYDNLGGCKETYKSTTGYVLTMGDTAICWKYRLQKSAALSTIEAEYMAAAEVSKELVWLRTILEELGREQTDYPLYCDNESAVKLAKNHVYHVSDGTIRLNNIMGDRNLADMFTKVVTLEKLKLCVASVEYYAEIRDQVFDVDKNIVKIKVVCCSPEKIRDKLCYKGGGSIQSIEIIEKPKPPQPAGDKPKDADKPKPAADKPKDAGKPKEPEKPKAADKPKEPQKPKPADKPKEPEKPKPAEKPKDSGKPPEPDKAKPKDAEKPKEAPKKPDAGPSPDVAKMVYEPIHGYPQMYPPSGYPMVGYGQYYDHGYGGAPFQHGYGMPIAPPPPPPSYGGFGYDNGYHGYNGNRSHYNSNDYGGQEDGEGCSIM
ncbi:uncharacterized protein LOC143531449 [Bidens hawaiensis]|uniref:uncharacterized protein LOC143531449 n=1 Tax=Bidens hawaiensis TaxID=980011 RepID=UPI00404A332B